MSRSLLFYIAVIAVLVLLAEVEARRGRKKHGVHRHYHVNKTNNHTEDLKNFLQVHHPRYKGDQHHHKRMACFNACRDAVDKHEHDDNATHDVTLTHFCWMTEEERKKLDNPHCDISNQTAPHYFQRSLDERQDAPASFSWVDQGAVTPVKQQGACGNCYAFGATGAMEGAYKLKYGTLVDLSPQQYTDCSLNWVGQTWSSATWQNGAWVYSQYYVWKKNPPYGNQGCGGGAHTSCWAYNNATTQPLNSLNCYSYTSGDNGDVGQCGYSSSCPVQAAVSTYVVIPSKDEVAMKQALLKNGPLACSMDANPLFQYKSGVISTLSTRTNHVVLVVGYGTTTDGVDYWIVKNSWGNTWGMDGYFWAARGINALNLAAGCAYPVLA